MPDLKYCYPGSTVLRNKLGITDRDRLFEAETELASLRLLGLQMRPVQGDFGFKHLCAIHKRIFQDLYPWAGRTRTVDIAKGDLFCRVQNIASYAGEIFPAYFNDCRSAKDDKAEFIRCLASHYADLNALHPFREGNGRAQREFARELCLACGYVLDISSIGREEMLNASIRSFRSDNMLLERIFHKAVTPMSGHGGPPLGRRR